MHRLGQMGPLAVQRPFFPEGPQVCHVVLLHPPGGIVPGDSLEVALDVQPGAHALVTTPAATKVYRSDGRTARQTQALQVSAGATLEWLPQETILFDGARACLDTRVDLGGDAAFIGWDLLCLGRQAAGEITFSGACRQRLDLFREGRPLLSERAHYGRELQSAPWGMRDASVVATLFAVSPALAGETVQELLGQLRTLAASQPSDPDLRSITVVSGALVVRYLGASVERARVFCESAWRQVRPVLLDRPACSPRIWST